MSVTFSYAEEEQKVREALKDAFGPNAAIGTAEGWHGRVHSKIVSDAFNGKSEAEKQR